jgi:hypothetical protein
MEQASKEEVKIPAHSSEATPKWRMATAVLGRALRISRGDCASELDLPSGKGDRKIAAPLAPKDGSHNAPSHWRVGSPGVRIEA